MEYIPTNFKTLLRTVTISHTSDYIDICFINQMKSIEKANTFVWKQYHVYLTEMGIMLDKFSSSAVQILVENRDKFTTKHNITL